jgi:hypothetical protein
MSYTFGDMTNKEIERAIAIFQQEHPDTLILPVNFAATEAAKVQSSPHLKTPTKDTRSHGSSAE